MTDSTSSVYERLVQVGKDVGSIEKSNINTQYKARGIDDVFAAFNKPLQDNGIVLVPSYDLISSEWIASASGGRQHAACVKGTFTFYGPDGDSVTSSGIGFGIDSSDKAVNKAEQAAFKYCILQQFVVPVGDEDADASSPTIGGAPQAGQTSRTVTPDNLHGRVGAASPPPPAGNSDKDAPASITTGQGKNLYRLWNYVLKYSRDEYAQTILLVTGEAITDDRQLSFNQASQLIGYLKQAAGEEDTQQGQAPQQAPAQEEQPPLGEPPVSEGYGFSDEPF